MDAENAQQIAEFAFMVLEELGKGYTAVSSEDLPLKRLSVNKLTLYSSILSRIIEVIINEELKVELTRLLAFTSQFLESNPITEYSMVETTPVDPGLLATIPSSSSGGRPEYVLPIGYINNCRKAGMSKSAIARHLQISRTTLYKHHYLLHEDKEISKEELTEIINRLKAANPKIGAKYVKGHLLAAGKYATQLDIRATLREVDPVGTCFHQLIKTPRIRYFVPGPDYIWNIDANEKLQPFHLYIHGCVDGFSRKLLYIRCAWNKRSKTVLDIFTHCIQKRGYPYKVRSDKGSETRKVARLMLKMRGLNSYITGKSVHNVRVERLWREVNDVTNLYKEQLISMQLGGIFDLNNKLHMLAVAYIFAPRIQCSLNEFQDYWNSHVLRTVKGGIQTPNALYLTGVRTNAPLVNHDCDNDSCDDSSDDSDFSDREDEEIDFQNWARNIVPDPLIDDGSKGEASLILLLNNL